MTVSVEPGNGRAEIAGDVQGRPLVHVPIDKERRYRDLRENIAQVRFGRHLGGVRCEPMGRAWLFGCVDS
jgi:hypothetical protein